LHSLHGVQLMSILYYDNKVTHTVKPINDSGRPRVLYAILNYVVKLRCCITKVSFYIRPILLLFRIIITPASVAQLGVQLTLILYYDNKLTYIWTA